MKPNKKHLKELILYILQNYNNEYLTETKLQKLLYFCDFGHFEDTNKSISGFVYIKNHFGPTLQSLPAVLNELEREGNIKQILGKTQYGSRKKTFSLIKTFDGLQDNFSKQELHTINEINQAYSKLSPRDISHISHADAPFLATRKGGDLIEYESVVYRDGPEEEMETEDKDINDFFSSGDLQTLITRVSDKLSSKNFICNAICCCQ
ncbi:SocA family protein [Patescibacteria group bacterium]|nr:SocA family protein [Patescibacteria group bacterium]